MSTNPLVSPALQPGMQPAAHYEAPVVSLKTNHRPAERSSFGRLVRAELRKLVDTRAGFWVLVGGLITSALAFVVLGLINGYVFKMVKEHPENVPPPQPGQPAFDAKVSWLESCTGTSSVMMMFLVVMAIMLATSEWTTRSALTTFTLEPRRGRVLAAKTLVALGLSLVVSLLALPLGALSALLTNAIAGTGIDWSMDWGRFAFFVLTGGLTMLFGMAWGLLTLSTAAGIILYFTIPLVMGVLSALAMLWSWIPKAMLWIDPNLAQAKMLGGDFTGQHWAAVLVTTLLWTGAPFAIGTWRWLRREVK